jgi:large subunit ribosomal protein L7A
MSYEKVKQAKKLRIGLKQTIKSIEQQEADEVIIAKDADPQVIAKVLHICQEHYILITYVDSMRKLGKTCGIEVGAAAVALKR